MLNLVTHVCNAKTKGWKRSRQLKFHGLPNLEIPSLQTYTSNEQCLERLAAAGLVAGAVVLAVDCYTPLFVLRVVGAPFIGTSTDLGTGRNGQRYPVRFRFEVLRELPAETVWLPLSVKWKDRVTDAFFRRHTLFTVNPGTVITLQPAPQEPSTPLAPPPQPNPPSTPASPMTGDASEIGL